MSVAPLFLDSGPVVTEFVFYQAPRWPSLWLFLLMVMSLFAADSCSGGLVTDAVKDREVSKFEKVGSTTVRRRRRLWRNLLPFTP